MRRAVVVFALVSSSLGAARLPAAVEKIDIRSRTPVLAGKPFGTAGPYEKVVAQVSYSLDPQDPANAAIVDLDSAPRGEDGKVRFTGDLVILRPVTAGRGNGSLLVEIPNRGGKNVFELLGRGVEGSDDPTTAAHFGDGFLLEQGFTVAWVGWQFDLPADQPDAVGLTAPPVLPLSGGGPVTGLVRVDRVFAEDGVKELPLGHWGHRAYPVANPEDGVNAMTVREFRFGRRLKIPRDQWRFARLENGKEVPDDRTVYFPSGFDKGRIYELVYVAKDPVVAGVGLTAVRDAVAHLRHDPASPTPGLRHTLGLGISQSGRFLREFVYRALNRDERGRSVFDGLFVHAAGAGRGSFNHRFAQPSRHAQPYESFFYPIDLFPHHDTAQLDRRTGRTDGLLDAQRAQGSVPKIFFTNTAADYWGRGASFLHTDPESQKDVPPGPEVRVYAFAGTQHFVGQFPPERVRTRSAENPADFRWSLRALLLALHAWVDKGKEPPPSRYPTIAAGELVVTDRMPEEITLPGRIARQALDVWKLDFGPRFEGAGIIDQEPPRVGEGFPALIFQIDPDTNDLGGIHLPERAVPLATYTGWNFRAEETGAIEELADFRGSFVPLPWTAEAAKATGDTRVPVVKRYANQRAYRKSYEQATERLAKEGYLRREDVPDILKRGDELWDLLAPKGTP